MSKLIKNVLYHKRYIFYQFIRIICPKIIHIQFLIYTHCVERIYYQKRFNRPTHKTASALDCGKKKFDGWSHAQYFPLEYTMIIIIYFPPLARLFFHSQGRQSLYRLSISRAFFSYSLRTTLENVQYLTRARKLDKPGILHTQKVQNLL